VAELSECCVYTIRRRDLLEADAKRKCGSAREGRRWTTAQRLCNEAWAAKRAMPIVFADSVKDDYLICWGAILTLVQVHDGGTDYSFEQVTLLPPKYKAQDLVLRSKRRAIAPKYIRPYAICLTPDFVKTAVARRE